MELWLLKFAEDFELFDDGAKYYVNGYGDTQGFVIRASDECSARKIASAESMGEPKPWWLDAEVTICTELHPDGDPGVILADEPTG